MKWIEINLDKFHTKSLKTYYLTDFFIIINNIIKNNELCQL